MTTTVVERWVDAAKILSLNVDARVLCPVCQLEALHVYDVINQHNSMEYERHLTCPGCKAYNSIKLKSDSQLKK